MPREIVLGNGRMLVNFDEHLNIRDIYYPYVGSLNHVGGYRCRIGVWVQHSGFSWLGSNGWDWHPGYRPETLVAESTVRHHDLQLEICFTHAVHPVNDLLLSKLSVKNHADHAREIRLFFSYDLRIAESDIGDTAYYNPFVRALIHYKRDNYFLISGYTGENADMVDSGIRQYCCGIKEFGGAAGAWRDAEDGHLSGNPIEQGSVDSVIGFSLNLNGGAEGNLRAWMAIGPTLKEVSALHHGVTDTGFDALIEQADAATRANGEIKVPAVSGLPERVAKLFSRSLQVIRTHIDDRGAILAATDSDIMETARAHYAYMWPRDGALVAYALDRAGYPEATARFFEFCANALDSTEARAGDLGGAALMHKYGPDGTFGATWHPWIADGEAEAPIQEDGTALVLWSLGKRLRHHPAESQWAAGIYDRLVKRAAEFLVAYRDSTSGLPLPSWDLWEERRGIHLFTTSAVVAALREAAYIAVVIGRTDDAVRYAEVAEHTLSALVENFWSHDHGYFVRTLYRDHEGKIYKDHVLDSSAYAIFAFGALPASDPKVVATMDAVKQRLWIKAGIGGAARYEADYYFRVSDDFYNIPGNPWIICTLWLAEYTIASALSVDDLAPALEIIEWAALCAAPSGILSEQIHPTTFAPLSVSPLTWSHAQFVTTVLHYTEKLEALRQTGG